MDEIANEFINKNGGPKSKRTSWTSLTDLLDGKNRHPNGQMTGLNCYIKGNQEKNRGIAIGSNIAKLGSRIVTERLKHIVEKNNMPGEIQCGFREGRSTTDNLLILGKIIENGGTKRSKVILAFIDLRKAYDKVCSTGTMEMPEKQDSEENV